MLISWVLLTILSLKTFANSVKKVFGKHVCARFLVICCSQFHFSFYASRTLPNSFANILVLYSLGQLINGNQAAFLVSAGVSVLVFRSELILLFGPCLLYALFTGRVSCSVLIDSYFWGRLIWPELEVFYFNTILNKSGQWGVSFCPL
ncbi:unnamed protein product [Trichobilharzia regenti]|nr:unnamed protein product [Trichobilharzia regenti]